MPCLDPLEKKSVTKLSNTFWRKYQVEDEEDAFTKAIESSKAFFSVIDQKTKYFVKNVHASSFLHPTTTPHPLCFHLIMSQKPYVINRNPYL